MKRMQALVFPSFLAGIGAMVAWAAACTAAPALSVRSWLPAALFFLGLSLGALVLLAIGLLTGGRWWQAVRRPLASMAAALPVGLAAMAVPIAGHGAIFAWTAAPDALSTAARQKLTYLAPWFMNARLAACALAWLAALWAVLVWAPRRPGRAAPAALALVLYAAALLFFTTDWMVALSPQFHSTIYGMLEAASQTVGALAAAIAVLFLAGFLAARPQAAPGVLIAEDFANLLFGLVLLWTYLAFMQWLIVWSGNLPDEIGWYLDRARQPWRSVLDAVVALQLAVPLPLFLSRTTKRAPAGLAALAAIVLTGHFLDVVWRISGGFDDGIAGLFATALAAVAIGGWWCAAALWLAVGRPAVAGWRGAHA